jgi:hypothetical protein
MTPGSPFVLQARHCRRPTILPTSRTSTSPDTCCAGPVITYLTWIGECVARPVTDLDSESDLVVIAGRSTAFMEEVLAGWRRHLAVLEDRELAPATYRTIWGESYNIGQMLEHAVVHPMRHRIQLERLAADSAARDQR